MRPQLQRLLSLLIVLGLLAPSLVSLRAAPLDDKQHQLADLQVQLKQYQTQLQKTEQAGGQVKKQLTSLEQEITNTKKAIQSLEQEITAVTNSLKETKGRIVVETNNLKRSRRQLAEAVRSLSTVSNIPLIVQLAQTGGFTRWLLERRSLEALQQAVSGHLINIQKTKHTLETLQTSLEDKSQELAQAESLKQFAARQLTTKKTQKLSDLKSIQADQERFRSLAKLSTQQITALREEINALQKSGVSLQDAVRLALQAGSRTGVRPALLLGVLEVETRLGQFLGTGSWKVDMHPRDRDAFLVITKKLGLNPDTQPISKKPDYGWGGAMGPAQFLPNTWLGYEAEIGRVSGNQPPSPWDFNDAFTAAALFLKHRGAIPNNTTTERAAVKSYISGDPNCTKSICDYYTNLVMTKAKNIEQELL